MFRGGFNDQVSIRDLRQVRGSADVLQDRITIIFGKFSELYSFSKIALDGLYPASQRLSIKVPKQNFVARGRSHLGNSVAHGACAYDADCFNCLRSDAWVQSFAL